MTATTGRVMMKADSQFNTVEFYDPTNKQTMKCWEI